MNAPFKQRRLRIGALTLSLAALFVLAAMRLTVIVLFDGPRLVSLARSEHTAAIELAAVRGPIVDRNGQPLALSAETRSIYAHPRILLESSTPAARARLAAALDLSDRELNSRLARKVPFVWLARHRPPAKARAVEELGLDGVGALSEYKRFYPESSLAAGVVGMAGTDGQGLSGIELEYDRLVRGTPLKLHFYHDALGHPILDSPPQLRSPRPGARVELTLDAGIQAEAERYLAAQIARSGATHGSVVVLEPFTGEVLALANLNPHRSATAQRLHDSAVQDVFEPGSTMKALLASIALQDHVIDTARKLYCEQGQWHVAGRVIHDDSRHGWLDLGGILEVSSNIGAAKLALALGSQRLYQGLTSFGLGRKSGIDLPGEAHGLLRPPSTWREIDLAEHGFGQGVAVTPIQLAVAYAAIANGGVVMRPYVVKAVDAADGRPLLVHTPQALRRALSPQVAHSVNQLLRGVVTGRDGTAHLARVADFTVAGKTGTAQMVNPATGIYYSNRLVSSFVGFVPAEDPRLVILVVLYDVGHGHFGGLVAAPVFSEVAADALQRLAVVPRAARFAAASLFPFDRGSEQSAPGDDASAAPIAAELSTNSAVDPAGSPGRIPNFRGLSLRRALALARARQLTLSVQGAGYVVSQQPVAHSRTQGHAVQIVLAAPAEWRGGPARSTAGDGAGGRERRR